MQAQPYSRLIVGDSHHLSTMVAQIGRIRPPCTPLSYPPCLLRPKCERLCLKKECLSSIGADVQLNLVLISRLYVVPCAGGGVVFVSPAQSSSHSIHRNEFCLEIGLADAL